MPSFRKEGNTGSETTEKDAMETEKQGLAASAASQTTGKSKPPPPPNPPPTDASAAQTASNIPSDLFQYQDLETEQIDENEESEDENLDQMSTCEESNNANAVMSSDICLSSGHGEYGGMSREGSPNETEDSQLDEEILTGSSDQHVATNTVADLAQSTTIISAQASATQHNDLNITQSVAEYPNKNITRVDGKGLWRSWKRNFNSQFMAILDLVDNSLDASIEGIDQGFIGRCHITPDTYVYTESNEEGQYATEKTTGIIIINNCIKEMRPLQRCLEVYDSSKVDSGADHVGENGVGLKQACATLSDLNFVLVKNGSDAKCELGIIAEKLQRVEGAYLPAFQFSNDEDDSDSPALAQKMKELFRQPQHADVAQCIAQYGAVLGDNPSLDLGIDRLCEHFDKICKEFYDSPYVFAVIVDKIRNDNVEERSGVAGDALTKIHVNRLMAELQSKIPRTYLHIPNSFEFLVKDQVLEFKYWQKRMVEFSHFTIQVGTTIPFDDPRDDPHKCTIRVYAGFDSQAMIDKSEKKCGSLYVYSRDCGRLITHHVDARTLLGLSAGGTEFCSCLRIIVDDYLGHLPLNPTKQDIAFSEKACGDILKENLYKWVGAVASMFYKYHINKFGGKKTVLTKKITDFAATMRDEDPLHTELCKLDLTTFSLNGLKIFRTTIGGMSLRVTGDEVVGSDTIYRLLTDPAPPRNRPSPKVESPISTSPATNTSSNKRRLVEHDNTMWTCRVCNGINVSAASSCGTCGNHQSGLITATSSTGNTRSSAATQPVEPTTISQLYQYERVTEWDVICEQGEVKVLNNNHPGNRRFWSIIHQHRHQQVSTEHRALIADQVLRQLSPGRLLIKSGDKFLVSRSAASIVAKALIDYSSRVSDSFAHDPNSHSQGSRANYTHWSSTNTPAPMTQPRPSTNTSAPLAPMTQFRPSTNNTSSAPPAPMAQSRPSVNTSSAPPAPMERSEGNTVDLTEDSPEDGDNGETTLTQNLEEHYKGLCTKLTQKVEKLHDKAERRKQEYNEVVQKNKLLEHQVEEMRSRIESLEKQLGS